MNSDHSNAKTLAAHIDANGPTGYTEAHDWAIANLTDVITREDFHRVARLAIQRDLIATNSVGQLTPAISKAARDTFDQLAPSED